MRFDYNLIKDNVLELEKVNTDMKNKIDSIENTLNLVNQNWSSDSSNNINKKAKMELSKMEEAVKEFKNCALYLQKVSNVYESLEEKQKQQINEALLSSEIFR